MDQKEIAKYTEHSQTLMIDAIKKIDDNGKGILFIVDDAGKLVGTLSDGDIRRWLLNQGTLDAAIDRIMKTSPRFYYADDDGDTYRYMAEQRITALPILNHDDVIVDIIFKIDSGAPDKQGSLAKNDSLKEVPVVIMAGGKGTRLYPYTKILPKPLIPIGDIPIAEHIINSFCQYGCKTYYMILNYKKNMIKAYFNEIDKKYKVIYIDEEMPLGTGGGVGLLKGRIDSTFIVSNCDILIRDDFEKIVKHHKEQKNLITMICSLKRYCIPYGIVHMGENGSIGSMEEKPAMSFFTNTGCYIVEPEVIEYVPQNKALDFPELIEGLKAEGKKVGVFPISDTAWLDMGQFDTMEEMRKKVEDSY